MLISQSRKALMIDFGYDFITGIPLGTDRALRRRCMYTSRRSSGSTASTGSTGSSPTLPRRSRGGHQPAADGLGDAALGAGVNCRHPEQPLQYDLPCIWYDLIPYDRRLPLETPFTWEEYSFTLHPLPGHTRYAVAIAF
ncbi:MAG: hypothetical protein IPK19_35930 [Chloroflexi bacterium]|nr:hypothetical protein [Chloroflexota bacterium]